MIRMYFEVLVCLFLLFHNSRLGNFIFEKLEVYKLNCEFQSLKRKCDKIHNFKNLIFGSTIHDNTVFSNYVNILFILFQDCFCISAAFFRPIIFMCLVFVTCYFRFYFDYLQASDDILPIFQYLMTKKKNQCLSQRLVLLY